MAIMSCKYLGEEHLRGFEHYKYSSIDTSPLSNYVMHPFWNQAVKLVPRWIAPNVLTLSGFLLTVTNAIILAYYDYDLCASSDAFPECLPVPSWVWLICTINHFLAHTLDGIDGKHARRTNCSGPLGELMDHGLDSWTCLFMPTCLYSVFGRSDYGCSPLRMYFIMWTVFFTFIMSHWEKYNTGVLYLPWGYDLSQIVLFYIFFVTYLKSYRTWKFTIPYLGIGSGQIFEIMSYTGTFGVTLPVCMYNIYIAHKKGKLRHYSWSESLRPLRPAFICFVMTCIWALFSPSDILNRDPHMFYWMVGTLFSNIAVRLIVSQMSSTRCEGFNWMLVPLGIAMGLIFWYPGMREREHTILICLTIGVILAHVHYGVCVVNQMCEHFKIRCFSVKRPVKKQ